MCTARCECPFGTVQDNDRCIPVEECGRMLLKCYIYQAWIINHCNRNKGLIHFCDRYAHSFVNELGNVIMLKSIVPMIMAKYQYQ